MEIKIVTKNKFSVIGKMGQGLSVESSKWVPQIWADANADFAKIMSVIKKNEAGNVFGVWGLMSDVEDTFARWGEYGKYLAGCEADTDALPPDGYVKWTVPTQTYLVAECNGSNYGDTFNYVVNTYIPQNGFEIIGAIHEHYPIPGNPDEVELYVPIRNGEKWDN